MTTYLTLADALKGADKFLVGYDRLFDQLTRVHDQAAASKNIPNYPPYNIRKTNENTYVIEMAVAGFSESEVDITLEDDKLTIKGSAKDSDDEILYQGLALRDFTRTFTLNDQIVIDNAEMNNGMLNIWLKRIIPESKKPKKIEINNSSVKQFLTE